METKIKRPVSVWISQIVIFIALILISIGLISKVLLVGTVFRTEGLFSTFAFLLWPLLITSLFLAATWGLAKRKAYGRWMGVASLSFLLLIPVFRQITWLSGPVQPQVYQHSTQVLRAVMVEGTRAVMFLLLIIPLAFSRRATNFFSAKVALFSDSPPPPPSFES